MKRLIGCRKMMVSLMCAVMVISIGILLTSFDSKAEGPSDDLNFYVNYPEPYTSDTNGYISVVYLQNGRYYLNTFVWSIEPDFNTTNNVGVNRCTLMDVTINGGTIVLQPWVEGGYYYYGLYEFGSSDAVSRLDSGYYQPIADAPMFSYTYPSQICGVLFGGNLGAVNLNNQVIDVPTIHWNNSPDAIVLYDYLWEILSCLNRVDVDTSDIIINLSWIYHQNVSINEKLSMLHSLLAEQLVMINDELDAIWYQLDALIEEQEKSNTWLGKIWDSIQEFINPSDNDSQKTNEFNNEANSQKSEIDELNNQNQVNKVDVGTASAQVDSNINYDDMAQYGGVLATITNNQYVLQLVLVVVSIVIISYVLFGKR